ncbi:hypothetical protein OMO38_19585 [Chryseobacterium sp. 09-1422]|jgi:hypothetical protein|uniref:RND efflux pump membrane fusion protein barrel-sandwich domain-containing protein n=1 Tax=Chryseobacterium kimseyorum TaxID=2984028 RepID=A0ABT3I4H9_9FLAO|nr:hypothetical protein [Chryseobacterium kimseyorum]MCW3170738.1 hypothetical protein [Chryseobacterium kimseyorum]
MNIDFTKDSIHEDLYHQPLKKRKWDRWIYLAILLLILFSLLRWIISSWIFNYADGFLMQQQFDVKFTNDIRIVNYHTTEGNTIEKGDTLFSYELYSDLAMFKSLKQDSIKNLVNDVALQNDLAAFEAEIAKKNILLQDIQSRILHWKSERKLKESLVYLDQITPVELSTTDRQIDDLQFQYQSVNAEISALRYQKSALLSTNLKKNTLVNNQNKSSNFKNFYISPIAGNLDRFRIAAGQAAYKSEIITSITHQGQFIRAYINVEDLDDFHEGDPVSIKLPYGFNSELTGKVKKMYSISEIRDTSTINTAVKDEKYGVVMDIVPIDGKTWENVKISNIPVKVRKLKFNYK